MGHDDSTLAQYIRDGDASAFESLFREYWAPLCAFAYRYVKQQDRAQDIVAEVFARIWEHRSAWEIRTSVQAYLYKAVQRHALNAIRHDRIAYRHGEAAAREIESAGLGMSSGSIEETLLQNELVQALWHQITSLPQQTRLIATLRWYDRLSHAEIADILDLPVKSVSNKLAYLMVQLKAQFPARD